MTLANLFTLRRTSALALAASLSACVVGPTYRAPVQAPVGLSDADASIVSSQLPPPTWWRTFEDPELDVLIEGALGANLDVKRAVARVDQARALFADARLDRFPRVTTAANYSRGSAQVPGQGQVETEQADVGFDAGWEIDLFGRVRHGIDSAKADAEASRADLRDVQVTVAAEVARNYLALRGAQARRAVAEANAETERETLRLTSVRRTIGYGDPVDVESARARLAAIEASIPPLATVEKQAAQRLAVLSGRRPGALDAELATAPKVQPAHAARLAVGDVSDLLRNRPDVRAAERRLAAETARTGVATADLFPRVRVAGFVGLLSGDISSLFRGGSWAWSIAPSITWPGLDMAGARARLRGQTARGAESLAAYQQVVLRAIEDLQDALTAYKQRQSELASLAVQVDAGRRAAELARLRFKEGDIDFLRVLDAERTRLQAEDALTQAQTSANTDVVAIYKALGGGWV